MPNPLRRTNAPRATILIRLLVGGVFLAEGIQKFLFPAALGVGRFVKIGIPAPQFFAPFVGVVEIVGGTLLIPISQQKNKKAVISWHNSY
jgi:uncharacterized membrane protein YphA (DoxX/SURF4 family)